MGCQAPVNIPRVDFSAGDLHPGSDNWSRARAQVRHAAENYGFFQAIVPGVSLELRDAVISALKEVFALPVATKSLLTSPRQLRGYVQNPLQPLYESIAESPQHIHNNFTNIIWPDGNSCFRETLASYYKSAADLDQLVRKMVLDSLGLMEKYYDSHIDSTDYVLRMMRYKTPETEEANVGLWEHTDKDLLTILLQSHDGLEVQTKDGDWVQVPVSADSITVMVGDCFLAWTNGRVHPPVHRVIMKNKEERYSIGLFSYPKDGFKVQAPEELVDEEHPLLFWPFEHGEFLTFFTSEEGRRAPSALTAFCGV